MKPATPQKKKLTTGLRKCIQTLPGTAKLTCLVMALLLVCSLAYGLFVHIRAEKELQGLYFPLKKIQTIYIWHSTMAICSPEYKVDLENGLLWEYHSSPFDPEGYQPRFAGGENEGFTTSSAFTPEKAAAFQENCARHGFGRWKEEYSNPRIMDGHHWGVTIQFADGTQRDTRGSNAYPPGWDELREDFRELTGKDLLGERIDL